MKSRFRCPHCGEDGIPRWEGASSSVWRPARCERCGGKAKVKAWVGLWNAAAGTVMALPLLVIPVLLFALTGRPWGYVLAAASVAVMWVVLSLPSWVAPLRKADPHDGESILQSIRRHYRRLRS